MTELDSVQQEVIHLRPDGSECRVRKPHTVCPCGAYHIRWVPVRAPSPLHTWETWREEGEPSGTPGGSQT
jgi:hypothetical protein